MWTDRIRLIGVTCLAAILVLISCRADEEVSPIETPATGGCCNLATGVCTILTEDQCNAQTYAHGYMGDNTVCSPNPCQQPVVGGACCLSDGSCQVLTSSACAAQGGTYKGDATDCSPNPCDQTHPPEYYAASEQVTTTEEAEIRTQSGAAIDVPRYAVPYLEGNQPASMVFSIERDLSTNPTVPDGVGKTSDIYRFGPEGFTFAEMVQVTVPYEGSLNGRNLALYRVNQTTGQSELYGGTVDSTAGTITAMTYKLSPWYVGTSSAPNTANGAFHVTNLSHNYWLKLCVEQYQLKYPEADASFTGDANCAWAPVGTIGWNSSGNWYLPQGTYTFCVEMNTAGTLMNPPGPPFRTTIGPYTLNEAWTYDRPIVVELPGFSSPGPDWQQQACGCVPVATVPVGTGQVQVTLTWHLAQALDLDLYVTEPSGEVCSYQNTTTATGGQLDRDNACFSYIDGRPENIFWASAPSGEYKVEVNWYSECSTDLTAIPFEVRVVNGDNARTYTMNCPADGTVEVARFTVSSARGVWSEGGIGGEGRVVFGEPVGRTRQEKLGTLPK